MQKNWNFKIQNCDDYDYNYLDSKSSYYKRSFNTKASQANNFYNKKNNPNIKKHKKNNIVKEFECSKKYNDESSAYHKNFKKTQNYFYNKYNDDDYFASEINNEFSNYENSLNNKNNKKEKNEGEDNLGYLQKGLLSEQASTSASELIVKEETKEKEETIQKPNKFGIKNIPHPKRKKGHGSCYIPRKKLLSEQQKKNEEFFGKKERKISISSAQTNFDSAKHSISTLNTSSSSYKEKDVFNEEKINTNLNEEIKPINNTNDRKVVNNKFDEDKGEKVQYQINPKFENTEILKVNVKLPNNRTAIFALRRYDDLFFTIKLFCEINSVDEKLIKPLIIKSLSTLNTIYQIYNCQLTSNEISVLKKVKAITDLE